MPKGGHFQPTQAKRNSWRNQLLKAVIDTGLFDQSLADLESVHFLVSVSGIPETRVREVLTAMRSGNIPFNFGMLSDLIDITLAVAGSIRNPFQTGERQPSQNFEEAIKVQARTVNVQIRNLSQHIDEELSKINTELSQHSMAIDQLTSTVAQIQSTPADQSVQAEQVVPATDTEPVNVVAKQGYTYAEAAQQLRNVDLSWVEKWVDQGLLKSGLFGGPQNYYTGITQESINNFLKNNLPELLNALQGRPSLLDDPEVVRLQQLAEQRQASETSPIAVQLPDDLMTQQQAADFMKVSYQTPKNWSDNNNLTVYRVGGRNMYSKSDLLAFERPAKGRGRPRKK